MIAWDFGLKGRDRDWGNPANLETVRKINVMLLQGAKEALAVKDAQKAQQAGKGKDDIELMLEGQLSEAALRGIILALNAKLNAALEDAKFEREKTAALAKCIFDSIILR